MEKIPSLENFVANAAGGGWEWFRDVDERIGKMLDPSLRKQQTNERQKLAEACARVFDGDDGQLLLEAMLDRTKRRTVYFVQIGIDPMQAYAFGCYREGQNSMIDEILRLIGEGRPGAPVVQAGDEDHASRTRRRRQQAGKPARIRTKRGHGPP